MNLELLLFLSFGLLLIVISGFSWSFNPFIGKRKQPTTLPPGPRTIHGYQPEENAGDANCKIIPPQGGTGETKLKLK